MSRLASAEKAHFYPLAPPVIPLLANLITAPNGGRLLDPCAGEGGALAGLADQIGLEAYGIELHPKRARATQQQLATLRQQRSRILYSDNQRRQFVYQADIRQMDISDGSFNLIYVNPPYDYDENDKRREIAFISRSTRWLQSRGVGLFVIPQATLRYKRLTDYLVSWYERLAVFTVPTEYRPYGETVIIGVRRARLTMPDENESARLRACSEGTLPDLAMATGQYEMPKLRSHKLTFLPRNIRPQDVWSELTTHGVTASRDYQDLIAGSLKRLDTFRPLTPLRQGHLVNLIAAGYLNNQLIRKAGRVPLLVKGLTYKSVATKTYIEERADNDGVNHITELREQFNTTIHALNPSGELVQITGDKLTQFLADYIGELTAIIDRTFKPVYTFDLNGYGDVIETLNPNRVIPNTNGLRGLLPAQQHAVAAASMRLDKRYLDKSDVLIAGEMGTGKTLMGPAIARVAGSGAARVIVICPPHLVEKWQREIKHVLPTARTTHLQSMTDVDRFFVQPASAEQPIYGVLKQTMASLGSTWLHAYDWGGPVIQAKRKSKRNKIRHLQISNPIIRAFWEQRNTIDLENEPDAPIVVTRRNGKQVTFPAWKVVKYATTRCLPRDPITGEVIMLDDRVAMPTDFVNHMWRGSRWRGQRYETWPRAFYARPLKKKQHHIVGLPEALRRQSKIVENIRAERKPYAGLSKPKPDYARWPLATYIYERYRGRADVFVADEVHQYKGAGSDRGYAYAKLVLAAKKHVALTGTIYGGKASTLFYLLYRMSPEFRREYGFNDEARFVRQFGLYLTVEKEHEPADSGSGNKRKSVSTKELPGASPAIVRWLLDKSVFIGLADMGFALPAYSEAPRTLQMSPVMQQQYDSLRGQLQAVIGQMLAKGDKSLLAAYLMSLLTWPDSPWRGKEVRHPRTDELVAAIPGLPQMPVGVAPKECAMLRHIQQEVERNRNVLLLCQQTATLDITPQWKMLLEENNIRTAVLKCAPDKRESWIHKQVAAGVQVIISHPRRVATGLDLLDFPTIMWIGQDWSVYTTKQVNRRSWRIGQTQPVEVYFYSYAGTLQMHALNWIAAKLAATDRIDGNDIAEDSLAELDDLAAGDIVSVLAKAVSENDALANVNDLSKAFAAANLQMADSRSFIGGYDLQAGAMTISAPPNLNGSGKLNGRTHENGYAGNGSDANGQNGSHRTPTLLPQPAVKPRNLMELLKLFQG